MSDHLTPQQRDAMVKLLAGGEALRAGTIGYRFNGFIICDEATIMRLKRKGAVRIDVVGESVFALPTEKGRELMETSP